MPEKIERAAALLSGAEFILCLTGAGVSAESGIPTFRDAQSGLWANFDPQQLASQQGFATDPAHVWQWYMARLQAMNQVEPNPGHIALAKLEELSPKFLLVTQNVDDLHERAGSREVVHLHGFLARFRCNECGATFEVGESERAATFPPECPVCAGLVRPDVVWFGEDLPTDAVASTWAAAEQCDLILVVGTSGEVYPAASVPYIAHEHGARVVEVNPDPTPFAEVDDLFLQGPSGEILPLVLERMENLRGSANM